MTMQATRPAGRLNTELSTLLTRSGAGSALLITKEGTAVTTAGDCSYLNIAALAALIAGMFTATKEVARMVGEKQFSILLQQGEKRHLHISLVSKSMMMVVIFEDYQSIGRVRHESRKTGRQLANLLETEGDSNADAISIPQFKEYALNLIDRIFVEKQ